MVEYVSDIERRHQERIDEAAKIVAETGVTVYEALKSLGATIPDYKLPGFVPAPTLMPIMEDGIIVDMLPSLLHDPEGLVMVLDPDTRTYVKDELVGPFTMRELVDFEGLPVGEKTDTAQLMMWSDSNLVAAGLLMPGEDAEYQAAIASGTVPFWMSEVVDDMNASVEAGGGIQSYASLVGMLPTVLAWFGFAAAAIQMIVGALSFVMGLKTKSQDALYFGSKLIAKTTDQAFYTPGSRRNLVWR